MDTLFQSGAIWDDRVLRSPAEHMAVDEALLLVARCPVLRLYSWQEGAVTFGCAQRFSDVIALAGKRVAIRRWTGGGVVFHGSDLTLSLALPTAPEATSSQDIYRAIHERIIQSIQKHRPALRLATEADTSIGAACFENPARHDVMQGAQKICGGALRRGRNGVLYQGSLKAGTPEERLGIAASFADFADVFEEVAIVETTAANIVVEKYGTRAWNERR